MMKKKITDLFDELPIEVLEEENNYFLSTQKDKINFFTRHKRLLLTSIIVIAIFTGCTAYVTLEMSNGFKAYFYDSNDQLVNEIYNGVYKYIDYQDYRLAVEGFVSEKDFKKILITVTAISEKGKENFPESCPKPILLQGDGSGSVEEHISRDNKYKKEFYFQTDSNATECSVILLEGDKDDYYDAEFDQRVQQLYKEILQKEGLNNTSNDDLRSKAYIQAMCEKAGKVLTFSIAPKNSEIITVEIKENSDSPTLQCTKVSISRMYLTIEGKALSSVNMDELYELIPRVSIVNKEGKENLIVYGSMDPSNDVHTYDDTIMSDSSSSSLGGGKFTHRLVFEHPININEIVKIVVNGNEYTVY